MKCSRYVYIDRYVSSSEDAYCCQPLLSPCCSSKRVDQTELAGPEDQQDTRHCHSMCINVKLPVRNGNFQSGLWKFPEISIVLHSLNGIPFMQVEISTCKFQKWKFPFLSCQPARSVL